jgi:hypothetical protein
MGDIRGPWELANMQAVIRGGVEDSIPEMVGLTGVFERDQQLLTGLGLRAANNRSKPKVLRV